DSSQALSAAISLASSRGVPVAIAGGTYLIDADLTIEWLDPAGGILMPANGRRITVNRVLDPGDRRWINESLGGTVDPPFGECRATWWGAVGDGTTDCTDALRAFIRRKGGHRLPPGDFAFTGDLQINTQRCVFRGHRSSSWNYDDG